MKNNEISELTILSEFKTLFKMLRTVEDNRIMQLNNQYNQFKTLEANQRFHLNKAKATIELNQELNRIDKLILRKQNESLIQTEKLKEEANAEIIYQESLIKIAQKEHDLQRVKVKSLYENERALAEEQVERIELGVKVNDTFVKTTLENQLLFAQQQIQCAESECRIRIENIELTRSQELAYANKKINYYKQKYEYDISKIEKELSEKLEDLNFKLLLFTEQKDNHKIEQQIESIQSQYQSKIDKIRQEENQDPEITRYQKVISDANNRADQAINEAEALKEQTVKAFEALYDQTKQKYDTIKETKQTEETRGIMPLLNGGALSSADKRLQQAIKEADDLYKERIEKPEKLIKELTEKLLESTEDEETNKFIRDLKAEKITKTESYNTLIQGFVDTRNGFIKAIDEENQALQESLTISNNEKLKGEFNIASFRSEKDIEQDYKALKEKERTYHKQMIKENSEAVQNDRKRFKKLQTDLQKKLKKTFKPYKKYIRFASKGLNAEKKELSKKYSKLLRKQLKETEDSFESIIK
jgi:hypothetical protein